MQQKKKIIEKLIRFDSIKKTENRYLGKFQRRIFSLIIDLFEIKREKQNFPIKCELKKEGFTIQ